MQRLLLLPCLAAVLATAGCNKDEAEATGHEGVKIVFVTDSGYTYQNDTVGLSDTLRIGLEITEGDEDLRTLYVDVSYDDGTPLRRDSLHMGPNPFYHTVWPIMRDTAGTEKWIFTAVDENDDHIARSLTFTVQ